MADDPSNRNNVSDDAKVRASIKTRELIDKLDAFVHGDVQMSATQVQAAMVLLKKTLPDVPPSAAALAKTPSKVTFKWKKPKPK